MLDAIRAALRVVARLPRSQETAAVVLEAYSLRETVESWRIEVPAPVVREATMQRVLGLHVLALTCARKAGRLPAEMPVAKQEGRASAAPACADDTGKTLPPPFDMEAFAWEATAPDSAHRVPSDPEDPAATRVPEPPSSGHTLRPASFPSSSTRRAAGSATQAAADSPEKSIGEMLDCVSAGDHESALDLAERLLASEPANPIALVCREQCLSALERAYRDRFGPLDRVPFIVGKAQASRLRLDHRAGFLLSLIDGVTSVEALLDLCAMPYGAALRILGELIEERVVGLR
jgi:hypothetical protein